MSILDLFRRYESEQLDEDILTEGEGDTSLPTLRKGSKGEEVKILQNALNEAGYDCGAVDGIFGRNTQKAVKAFQQAKGLAVDGVCGKRTWTALGLMPPEPEPVFKQPPNFKQYDSRWAGKMYSNHNDKKQTMKSSGCGPTAMADIVAAWWDANVTPWDLAQKSMNWGTRTYDSGTSSTFFRKCADTYKAYKYQTTSNIDTAINCLQSGGLVVVCFGPGTKGKSWYQRWTKGGHYCCLWRYKDGVFDINDPASSSSTRAKGTREAVANCRKGFYLFWNKGE